jgi:hypothetical protein
MEFSPQPFAMGKDGKWDFFRIQDAYFEKACQLLEAAIKAGMTPALVLLWCDFVKDTWACQRLPEHEMPLEAIQPYVEYAGRVFMQYDPIFLVSGDTDFKSPETTARYLRALHTIKKTCPKSLTTFHPNPETDLPDGILNAPELDFYMFQSGHGFVQDTPYKLARRFSTKPIKRPTVNGEPCYEGHGFGSMYGRFGTFHVRKAIWQSLLSGAKAGATYGAHGVWSWHRAGLPFGNAAFSSMPFSWRAALRLPGAWDAVYAKWVFETYGLFDLDPLDNALHGKEEIRIAASPRYEKVAAYIPYPCDVRLNTDLGGYETLLINLSDKLIAKPLLRSDPSGTTLQMPDFNGDALFLAVRK